MIDLLSNLGSVDFARRGFASLARVVVLAAGLLTAACGGGGGGGATDDGGSGGGAPGSTSGTLYWITAGKAATLNLWTKEESTIAPMSIDSEGQLGFGGGIFTDVVTTGILPYDVTINLRDVAPSPYTLRTKLRSFPLNGFVHGPVQPSPDGRLFAIQTS